MWKEAKLKKKRVTAGLGVKRQSLFHPWMNDFKGEMLPHLLWTMMVDDLFTRFVKPDSRCTDMIMVLFSLLEVSKQILMELLQNDLNLVYKWLLEIGFAIYPSYTVTVPFTKRIYIGWPPRLVESLLILLMRKNILGVIQD